MGGLFGSYLHFLNGIGRNVCIFFVKIFVGLDYRNFEDRFTNLFWGFWVFALMEIPFLVVIGGRIEILG